MEKKKIYTFIIPLCTIVVLATFCWWGYNRLSLQEEQTEVDLYALVPADCEAVIETKDINALHKTLHNSHYISQYGMLNVSALLNLLTDNLETIVQQQAHGLSTEMNRQLLVSFHQPGSTHDQVIYGRFGNGDIASITRLMQQSIGVTHAPKKLTYKGEKIIIYPLGRDFLACYFKPGFFAVSLQKKLIEKVIDAYTGEKSLRDLPAFKSMDRQTKHTEQLSLYLPAKEGKDNPWRHFEIRLGTGAIYLTSSHTPIDTCQSPAGDTLIERTDGALLPKRVQMMVQRTFTPKADATEQPTLGNLLAECGCHEVTAILFSPTPADTGHHQLLMLPLTADNAERVKQSLRHTSGTKRRPSIWTQGAAYPTWQCAEDSTLSNLFIQPTANDGCWLGIYQNHLLASTNRETLQSYIMGAEDDPLSATTNQQAYVHCLDDLAEQANYTLVADMNDIVTNHPAIAENASMIPDFFFKHKDFFKHFMLSTQHINNGGQVNTQLILTLHGDSIR